ncbi:hypothetical protein TSOC_012493 [Tetrabaena socialis]|uniref:Uncharacterized protein n=1 Tax=Tetrabaena socialis TaxID=47790 RepID=A0A2J7ZMW6_9CHLO|nr:hypothetical protein TSOC_012493 [Tetrabaena socialis]|eukprot:PNH01613.1 hypothetical protein TSOC_012493 [Tetrabaena socialis]
MYQVRYQLKDDHRLLKDDHDLLDILRSELTGQEQQLFITGFAAYLQYDTRNDFVINLDDVYTWLGFTCKNNTKRLVVKSLTEGVHYRSAPILLLPKEQQVNDQITLGGRPNEQILLTIHGFKQLCLSANTEKGRRVREYYISMEEILFEYTRRNAVKERERFTSTIEKANALTAAKEAELAKIRTTLRTKIYEEIPKLDNVYVNKEVSELASDAHKVGKAIDPKKREVRAQARSRSESQLNTGSAQGSRMIYKRPTHNAKVVEDILKVAQRRYHIASIGGCERYNNNVEHSVDVIDIAATLVDTLASSFEYMKRGALFRKVIANLKAVQGDDDVEAM